MNAPSGRRFTLALLAVLTAALAVAYSTSFTSGFEFDDWHVIEKNPAIRSLANIPRYFTDVSTLTVLRENVDVRPVLVTTFALNYAISGLRPWSWHLVNLLIHLVTCLLIFFIVRDHLWWPISERGPDGIGRLPAAAAALLFALAPLNHEPIVYISTRSALLATCFYLAAFLAFLRKRPAAMGLFQVLALLTKAIALTLPGTIVMYDFIYRDRARHRGLVAYLRDWKRLVVPVAVTTAVDVAYMVYRHALLPPWTKETYKASFTTPWIWFMSQWSAILYYVRLFVWPDSLAIDHDFPYTFSLTQTRAWLPLLVIVLWIVLALRVHLKRPFVAFGSLWFFITLSPESTFIPLAEVVNEHRPYIASSLGLSVVLVCLLWSMAGLFGEWRVRVFSGACAVLCVAAIPVVLHQNWIWQDSVRLWQNAIAVGPSNTRAWMNAGRGLMARQDYKGARTYLEKAKELAPNYSFVHLNLSALSYLEGDLQASLVEAQEAVRVQPEFALAYFYLGSALERLGRADEAAAAYGRSAELNPSDPQAAEALSHLKATKPQQVEMSAGLQSLYVVKDPDDAIKHFRKVLEMNPDHYGATLQLAKALDAAGRPAEARPFWEKFLPKAIAAKDPSSIETARTRLAQPDVPSTEVLMNEGLDALYKKKDPEKAITLFRQVRQQMPSHYGARFQLAKALDAAGRPAEAHPLWEEILTAAQQAHDAETEKTARERLARKP